MTLGEEMQRGVQGVDGAIIHEAMKLAVTFDLSCDCIRCHSRMDCVLVRGDASVGWVCQGCDSVWQLGIGWNGFVMRYVPGFI